jgi:predicted MPP superfamily phosphohydrolase
MNRIVGFALFFSLFLSIFFGMHLYVFSRIAGMLGLRKNMTFYFVLVGVAASFPLANFAVNYFIGTASRFFYAVASSWLGVLFLAVVALLIYEIVHLFVKTDQRATGIIIIVVVSIVALYAIVNAMFIHVRTLEIPVANLEKEASIVQLSDIHVGTIHNTEYLRSVVEKVNNLHPDMVLITGDLVDGSGPLSLQSVLPLKDIKSKTFFTTGNHEQYEGIDKVSGLLTSTGVQILRNEIVDYKGIQIVGIDNPDAQFTKNNNVIGRMKINKTKPTVLMFHPPQGLEDANKAGVDLQLSGHTHDGQIMPFNLIVRFFYPRMHGLYNYNGTYLYASPGTGTWGPPMRLGSRNEIALIELVKK